MGVAARLIATLLLLAPMWAGARADVIYAFAAADGRLELSNVPTDVRFKPVVRSPEPGGNGAAAAVAPRGQAPAQVDEAIRAASRATGMEPALLHAVVSVESGYDPHAVSPKGAMGLMQLMPATARRYGVADAFDARENVLGGARHLRDLLRAFDDDVPLALAAYNAGEEAVRRNGNRVPPYAETLNYVPRVLSQYRRYRLAL